MRRFWSIYKVEQKLGFRCPDMLIFGVGMPVGVLILIAVVAGNKTAGGGGYTFLQSAFASLMTVGICASAFMGIPLSVADYRDKKILKHFFVTPCSPMLFLSGATIPFELFPEGLQKVAAVLPLTQGIKLMKQISLGEPAENVMGIIVLMAVITVICTIASKVTFRWE